MRPKGRRGAVLPWWSAPAVDLVAVLVFVTIGRSAHDHGLGLSGEASTAWPFATGWAVGWLVIWRRHAAGAGLEAGATAWLSTVAVGMILRVVAGQGVDVTFIAVALAFVALFLLGWRAVVAGLRKTF